MKDPPSLCVLVPGFGMPHLEHKIEILRKNRARVASFPWSKVHWTVCCYEDPARVVLPSDLRPGPDLTWIFEPGIVGQYIHRHAAPGAVDGYDYVLLLLDDIELQDDIQWSQMIRMEEMFQLDIYSPTLTLDSKYQFTYMLTQPQEPYDMKITCACEAFCYWIPRRSYAKYYALLEPDSNPWLWGLDTCLYKCFGMRIGMWNRMTVKHYYKNESYPVRPDANPALGRERLFQRLGVTMQELSDQISTLYYVFMNPVLAQAPPPPPQLTQVSIVS